MIDAIPLLDLFLIASTGIVIVHDSHRFFRGLSGLEDRIPAAVQASGLESGMWEPNSLGRSGKWDVRTVWPLVREVGCLSPRNMLHPSTYV